LGLGFLCWGEVGKVVGVVGCGGEAAGKEGSGVVAMAGKKVSEQEQCSFFKTWGERRWGFV
nr:hypothetical protein [Tanacetum cinerariifolium]